MSSPFHGATAAGRIARLALAAVLTASASQPLPALIRTNPGEKSLSPVLVGRRFVAPDTLPDGAPRPLRNGDRIEIWTRWAVPDSSILADSLEVFADFSMLDPGDPGNEAVRGRHLPGGVYVLVDTLSGEETRPDSAGIPIPLTAVAPTGSTIDRSLVVCLSNHPPEHIGTFVVRPKTGPYRAGDSLVIETSWRTPFLAPLRLFADLDQIVRAESSAVRQICEHRGGDTYRIRWQFPDDRTALHPDGGGKPIPVLARDDGCGVTRDDRLRIDLDNTPPDTAAFAISPLPLATAQDSLTVSGLAPNAARIELVRNGSPESPVDVDGASGRFQSRIPLVPGENRLQVRGADLAGNWSALFPARPVVVRRIEPGPLPPALVDYRFLRPDTLPGGSLSPIRRGHTVEIRTRWEVPGAPELADELEVLADFSLLDPGPAGNDAVRARHEPGGVYTAVYTLSELAARPDTSGIPIPFAATGRSGTTIDRRIEVCLSNHPPVHHLTRIVAPKGAPYRTGDSLVIETVWTTPFRSPLRVTADLSQIVSDTAQARPRTVQLGPDVYRIYWRLPFDREQLLPDGAGRRVPILARDAGCGATRSDVPLGIDIDTQPPDESALVLDPLPSVTTAESLRVTGRAPGSVVVLVFRDLSVKGVAEVDTLTGRFGVTIPLAPDENRIQIKGEDLAGNPTPLFPSPAVVVTRVSGAVLQVGAPYSRQDRTGVTADDIRLRDPAGMENARIRIYNLEGDCIWEQEFGPGRVQERVFHWNGRDRSGERAPQGYYLVRGEWRDGGGRSRALVQGLLLKD